MVLNFHRFTCPLNVGKSAKRNMIHFIIPIAPRTKKNSQQIITVKGRPMIIPSKLYKQYEKDCKDYIPKIATITTPVNVKAVYYMPTKRKVDLCNLHEALCDMLVHYKVVDDDNTKIIYSMDGSYVDYDKEHPRTEIYITEVNIDG